MIRILLVDDDRTALATLATALGPATFDIARAMTVEQARMVFHEKPTDLVVLEIALAQDAGWKLLEEFVALGTRVIILTRHRGSDVVVRALDAGAIDVVGKPFVPDELLARITARLQQPPPAPKAAPSEAAPTPPAADTPPLPPPLTDANTLSLGEQMSIARKQRNISLVQANLETSIQMYYIQALEEDKYGLLPRGSGADAIVAQYAAFLGLDADAALADFRRLHRTEEIGPRDLSGQPLRRIRRWPRLLALSLVALLTCVLVSGALKWIFPQEISNVVANVQGLFVEPTATLLPTATLTPIPTPTLSPTLTPPPTLTPTSIPTPTTPPTPATPTTATPPTTPTP